MQPGGRNPIRRSKKIGKTQGGRDYAVGSREKLSRIFTRSTWDKLSMREDGLQIIRENPSRNHFHPCNKAEIQDVLTRLPQDLVQQVRAIVLRRIPKHDLRDDWHGWAYWRCVVLNAFPTHMRMVFQRKPTKSIVRSYARWCDRWEHQKSSWILQWTADELKRYVLYDVLLHEIGHVVDPEGSRRSNRGSEAYANNFALEWARKLKVI